MSKCFFFFHKYKAVKSGRTATLWKCYKCNYAFWEGHLV